MDCSIVKNVYSCKLLTSIDNMLLDHKNFYNYKTTCFGNFFLEFKHFSTI